MRTTTLGSNGPEVGVIGLGCMGMTFSYDMETPRDEATSIAVIHQALDLGMTLIDTADAYGPHTNEELVGRALAGGHRDRAVLATKVGIVRDSVETADPSNDSADRALDGRPEYIRASIDGSLRRLGTDHVDLYQLHRVDPQVPVEESWAAMAETVAAGKARHIGLSEVTADEIKRAQAVHPVTSVQSELSLWTRDALAVVLPAAASWSAGSRPSTICPRTTSGAGSRASSRTRCGPTWRSSPGCGRSPRRPEPPPRRSRWPGCFPRDGTSCPSPGPRPRNTWPTTPPPLTSSSARHTWRNSTPCPLRKAPATDMGAAF